MLHLEERTVTAVADPRTEHKQSDSDPITSSHSGFLA